ncbi:nitrogen regulation protein NR(II) [Evansella sp. AB-rgal1]|uniref:two-component system sensor histidine kinase NtrB n=1 Tax=Evansella sp. AB-rgal1 TaxID=3242696 RepID=UPI00359E3715
MVTNQRITAEELDFKQVVDHSLNAKLIIDGTNVLYVNNACLDMLKVDEEMLIANGYKSYFHPDYQEKYENSVARALEGKRVELMEQKMIRSDGSLIDVEVVCAPFYNKGTTLVQVIIRDITERKENEKLLLQSEKLSMIGEVAAGIVHEIRNPLTTIKGFLQLIESKDKSDQKYIQIMKSEVTRIEKIANDLLKYSKPKVESFKVENIVEVVQDVLFMWETEAFKRKITMEFAATESNIPILSEKTQITQVFINLIKNAMEAVDNQGEGEITIEIHKSAAHVFIKIRDNGYGIPKEMLDKLGTSFHTTKEDGTGLGLMVTYNIIKNHNGTVIVDSQLGEGTTFTIVLPIEYENRKMESSF